jgi:hypothetical protein
MKYYIDFEGYCEIDAENAEKAQEKFWDLIYENKPLPHNLYEIFNTEPKVAER